MEFEHVGLHCQTCKRKDFLPLNCATCTKTFCKECINESAHLSGCQRRDMTSFDCPVCGKSVKHDKADDVNEIWSMHFSVECTQTAAPSKSSTSSMSTSDLCYFSECRKVMGPSNRFRCEKCRREVCLSHRMPEAHACSSLASKQIVSKSSVQSKTRPTSSAVEACPMCQARFGTVDELVRHFDASHGNTEPPPKPASVFDRIGSWFR